MLKLTNITAKYGDVVAVKNISFTLDKGQSLAILGPNGCGKTTLLKAIAGLMPFEGHIHINGQCLSTLKPKQMAAHIALLAQAPSFAFEYSVYDTVMMGRYHFKKGLLDNAITGEDKDVVMDCLNTLDLWQMKDKSIKALSGGQLQRVFLARTLAQQPDIILLDEPTNHLDLKYQIDLIDFLKKWVERENKAVIGVFHDLNLARHFTNNMLLMKDGGVVAQGEASHVMQPRLLKQTYGVDVAPIMVEMLTKWQ
ncbi:MAG: ABC transporter ATP-binding protein [Defluviitaleaceae bacterium]|nr:ABC transporter ATP-binding protein [Defluviitaleaceae bacterium]